MAQFTHLCVRSHFINARSTKPVGVFDRQRNAIVESSELYAGCKAKVAITFYPYSQQGNHGIGAGLDGVQKIADGDPIGGGAKPSVESMFDILDDEDDDLLNEDINEGDETDEDEPEPEPAPKRTAKKAAAKKATPAKKAAAKKAVEIEDDGDEDDDMFADLDDLDD